MYYIFDIIIFYYKKFVNLNFLLYYFYILHSLFFMNQLKLIIFNSDCVRVGKSSNF